MNAQKVVTGCADFGTVVHNYIEELHTDIADFAGGAGGVGPVVGGCRAAAGSARVDGGTGGCAGDSERMCGDAGRGWSVPKVHVGKVWYVDFYARDEESGRMKRKKYTVEGFANVTERRKMCRRVVKVLLELLQAGWNVWRDPGRGKAAVWMALRGRYPDGRAVEAAGGVAAAEREGRRGASGCPESVCSSITREWARAFPEVDADTCGRCDVSLGMARRVYERWVDRMTEAGVLRRASAGRYGSYLHVFFAWLEKCGLTGADVRVMEGPRVVRAFLDYLLLDTTASACTHNNYLSWLSTFCDWMRERGYIERCGTEGIRKLREAPKKREQLSPAMLRRMREYLSEEGEWGFLLACVMEYYTFVRPKELTFLRINDIEVKAQRLIVSGSVAKNRRDGAVALNDVVLALMIGNGVFRHDGEEYLFSEGFAPGRKRLNPAMFRNRWARMRQGLGWPDCYQFYSLKDTGIRDLANAEGIVVARDQARHADISTTNKYLKGAGMTVHAEAKKFKGGL